MKRSSIVRVSARFETRSFVVGIILTGILALLWLAPLSTILELKTLDLFFQLKGAPKPDPGIVHIDIDDTSIDKIGRWPWDRFRHAQLVDTLAEAGAKAIVLDITFPDLQSPDNDSVFVSSCALAGNVYVGYNLDRLDTGFSIPSLNWYGKAREALLSDLTIEPDEIAARTGLPEKEIEKYITRVKEYVIEEQLRQKPETQDALAAAGGFEGLVVKRVARKLRAEKLLEKTALDNDAASSGPESVLIPPFPALAAVLRGAGFVSVQPDTDGVLRHIPLLRNYRGLSYPYLSLALLRDTENLDVSSENREVTLKSNQGQARISLNKREEMLLDWSNMDNFSRIPYAAAIQIADLRRTALNNLLQDALTSTGLNARLQNACEEVKRTEMLAFESGKPLKYAQDIREQRKSRDTEMTRLLSQLERFIESAKRRGLSEKNKSQVTEFDRLVKEVRRQLGKSEALAEKLRLKVSGKICVVGSTHTGSTDLHTTPQATEVPGCMAHSTFLSMYSARSFPTEPWPWSSLLLLVAGGILVSFVSSHMSALRSITVTILAMAGLALLIYFIFVSSGAFLGAASPLGAMLVSFAGTAAYRRFAEERAKKTIRNIFQRQVGRNVAEAMIRSGEEIRLGGEMRTATVYFSDLAGFSSISEKLTPPELVALLNEYFTEMCAPIVEECGGYLDKFEGDAILAVFGIPVASENSARDACYSALQNQSAIAVLRKRLAAEGRPEVYQRIGLSTGEMVVGYVGSPQRHDYTVIGDAVNLGQRLEAANKVYKTSIIISETTFEAARDFIEVRELDITRVPGKAMPVRIYELASRKGELPEETKRAFSVFAQALESYRKRRFNEALEGFEKVMEILPDDGPSKLYMKRCGECIETPPPDDWECVHNVGLK